MPKKRSPRSQPSPRRECEGVEFAEVEFPLPVRPRVVVCFAEGLSLLIEDERAIDLAAEFIVAFRYAEKGGRR